MKTATLFAVAALLACATAQPVKQDEVQYEVGFSLSWQNVDNLFAKVMGADELPECTRADDGTLPEACESSSLVFQAADTDGNELGLAVELEPEVPPAVSAAPESEDEAQLEDAAPAAELEAPAAEPETEQHRFCRSIIENVDASCEPSLCSDQCRVAAQAAVKALRACKRMSMGLAYSSCGMHPQTFGMELEIVARKHDCECAGRCPRGGVIKNPYCNGDATMSELRAHRVTRDALLLASLVYLMLWLSVWFRYTRFVEAKYAAVGRPMGRCQRAVFRIMAIPLTACLTQFGICVMAMMPPFFFMMCVFFFILLRKSRRQRALAIARQRRSRRRSDVLVMAALEAGIPVSHDPVALKEAQQDCAHEDLVVAEPAGAEVVVGEVLAEPAELVVATEVEDKPEDEPVMVAAVVA